jgi:hypothetical protein
MSAFSSLLQINQTSKVLKPLLFYKPVQTSGEYFTNYWVFFKKKIQIWENDEILFVYMTL